RWGLGDLRDSPIGSTLAQRPGSWKSQPLGLSGPRNRATTSYRRRRDRTRVYRDGGRRRYRPESHFLGEFVSNLGACTVSTTPLLFNAFVMNTGSHIQHGQWRHPEARQTEFNDLGFWIDLARTLEDGLF